MFEGHTNAVVGALELTDGRLLSWAWDHTLRLWDSQSGVLLTTLDGCGPVKGALELTDGRLLSWGGDTLRLLDKQSGMLLATLAGHTGEVRGALELTDDRLLSWGGDTLRLDEQSNMLSRAEDHTLRLWDRQSGVLLATLIGHISSILNIL
jgi:WD40 repeat protein